uniref:Uncharacterized protein n=1 Tax=Acrobeloides nanus TaxID=290746 RepID=A0A914CH56_9BILA
EATEKESDLAPKKSIESIKSSEDILQGIEIMRAEIINRLNDPNHTPHLLLKDYKVLEYSIADILQKIRSSHLEKSLMMIPFSYIPDILRSLCKCILDHFKIELSTRVVLFLIRFVYRVFQKKPPFGHFLAKALQEHVKELEEQLAKKKARRPTQNTRKNKSKDLVPRADEKVAKAEVDEPLWMRKQLANENSSGRIHHNLIINSIELLPLIEQLRTVLPTELSHAKDVVGLNSIALKFLQLDIEERENVKLFKNVSEVTKTKKKKTSAKTALIKTFA